jgi:hypothetical protein
VLLWIGRSFSVAWHTLLLIQAHCSEQPRRQQQSISPATCTLQNSAAVVASLCRLTRLFSPDPAVHALWCVAVHAGNPLYGYRNNMDHQVPARCCRGCSHHNTQHTNTLPHPTHHGCAVYLGRRLPQQQHENTCSCTRACAAPKHVCAAVHALFRINNPNEAKPKQTNQSI